MRMNSLVLSKEIYPEHCLSQAKSDYTQLATITISENSSKWIIEFSDCVYDINQTIKEFENYLIELTYQGVR